MFFSTSAGLSAEQLRNDGSRAQLLDSVWGDHQFVEERTVDVSVRRLRLALGERGDTLIETVRGVGYRLSLKGR